MLRGGMGCGVGDRLARVTSLPDLTTATPAELFRAICDIPSVSGEETALADAIEHALRAHPHLDLERDGDAIVARTDLGRAQRVVIAGHIDTVPVRGNLPTRLSTRDGAASLWGRGTVDMKGASPPPCTLPPPWPNPDMTSPGCSTTTKRSTPP